MFGHIHRQGCCWPGMFPIRLFTILFLILLLPACSSDHGERTVRLNGYMMTLTADPFPLSVGRGAALSAFINDGGGRPVESCGIRFRQFMPDMQMSTDNTYIAMTASIQPGYYQAQTANFSMGGDWQLDFIISCGPRSYTATFRYSLAWPE